MSRTHLRALSIALLCLAPGTAFAAEGGLVLLPALPPFLSGVAESLTGVLGVEVPVGWNTVLLLLFFAVLVVPLNGMLFKPLLRVLDERNERIAGTRERAERLERDAAQVLERYESAVRGTREEAESERRAALEEVRQEAQQQTGAARSDAEQRIESARQEVGRALDEARGGLRSQAQELARQAAAQVLGRAL